MPNEFTELFNLRRAITRIGSADWLRWWDCHALTPTGDYVVSRLFRRTPQLSAAHVAFMAARAEHRRRVPKEFLVHLFDFGEAQEGAVERWLVARKADGWKPEGSLPAPTEDSKRDARRALEAVGLSVGSSQSTERKAVLVDTVDADVLDSPAACMDLARRLAEAYGSSSSDNLIAPYARVRS